VAGAAWADSAGGTSGVLWGAMLDRLGADLPPKPDPSDVARAVGNACRALADTGGAAPGDKTMLDALVPFSAELTAAVSSGRPLAQAWDAAAQNADRAASDTAALRPRIGRARPLADRSVGSPDPGAVSLALCVRAVSAILR
jgi:D-erythrulose 4-kinase